MTGSDSRGNGPIAIANACDELGRRLRAGEDCRAELFLDSVATAEAEPDEILDLLYTEFVVREQLGQRPQPADWLERFPQWRSELEELFEIHVMVEVRETGAGWLTERPAADGVSHPLSGPPHEGPVSNIGGYELLREIGRGGMGVVYEARQPGLNRSVALKTILPPHGERERARFRTEAEATAKLSHPSIVPVFEVGQEGDCPYLVMEYVAGQRLDRRLADGVMSPAEGAELVRTLALAVAYAHERGVIHRDLKPANILLQSQGAANCGGSAAAGRSVERTVPRITDFGLAKTISDASLSQSTIAFAGTPSYMAPEQCMADGRAGPAADIYSLGTILYEAITGGPPFRGQSVLDIVELVRSQEPVPPSRLVAHVPRDLETICLKCLAKLPEHRYPSAAALAEDLERCLEDRPILARPVGPIERVVRWSRRNRPVASLTGGILVLLVAGSVIAAGLSIHAVRERDRANENAARELASRELADRRFGQAEQAVAQYLDGIEEQDLLKEANFFELRKTLLLSAIPFYEEFVASRPGDVDLETRRARAYGRLGFIRRQTGDLEQSTSDFEKMRDALQRLRAGGHVVVVDLAAAHHELGITLALRRRNPSAEREYRQALALKRALVEQSPAAFVHRHKLALLLRDLGSLQLTLNSPAAASTSFAEAVQILERLREEEPSVLRFRQDASGVHNYYGVSLEETDPVAAETQLRLAVALSKEVFTADPRRPNHRVALATAYQNLAWFLSKAGRHDKVCVEVEHCLTLRQQLAAEFPSVPSYQNWLAVAFKNLGVVRRVAKDFQNALEALDTSVTLLSRLAEDFPATPDHREELANALEERAVSFQQVGRAMASEQDLARALALRQKLAEADPLNASHRAAVAKCRLAIFSRLVDAKKFPEAEEEIRAVVELRNRLFHEGPGDLDNARMLAVARNNLATTLKVTNRRSEALAVYDGTMGLWTGTLLVSPLKPSARSEVARQIALYSTLCRQNGDLDKARGLAAIAAEHQLQAAVAEPGNETFSEWLRDSYFEQAEIGRLQRDHVSVALAADRLGGVRPGSGDDAHWAARYFGRCVQLAQEDEGKSEEERAVLALDYANRGMGHLQEAVRRGYRNASALRKLDALGPLRDRADFQSLLSDVERVAPMD